MAHPIEEIGVDLDRSELTIELIKLVEDEAVDFDPDDPIDKLTVAHDHIAESFLVNGDCPRLRVRIHDG